MKDFFHSDGFKVAVRLLFAGVFLVAGFNKITANHLAFAQSIESFQLVPAFAIEPLVHFLPAFEVVLGILLIGGIWTRESAALGTGLLAVFTGGLASVLLRGLNVDCGCFGDLFGGGQVTWMTLVRNGVFIFLGAAVTYLGGGKYCLLTESLDAKSSDHESQPSPAAT